MILLSLFMRALQCLCKITSTRKILVFFPSVFFFCCDCDCLRMLLSLFAPAHYRPSQSGISRLHQFDVCDFDGSHVYGAVRCAPSSFYPVHACLATFDFATSHPPRNILVHYFVVMTAIAPARDCLRSHTYRAPQFRDCDCLQILLSLFALAHYRPPQFRIC
jgi:hypothetical protein